MKNTHKGKKSEVKSIAVNHKVSSLNQKQAKKSTKKKGTSK